MKYMEVYRIRKVAKYAEGIGIGAGIGGASMAAINALLSDKGKRWRGALKGLAYGAPLGAVAATALLNADNIYKHDYEIDDLKWTADNHEDRIKQLKTYVDEGFSPLKLMQSIVDADKLVRLNGDKVEYK